MLVEQEYPQVGLLLFGTVYPLLEAEAVLVDLVVLKLSVRLEALVVAVHINQELAEQEIHPLFLPLKVMLVVLELLAVMVVAAVAVTVALE